MTDADAFLRAIIDSPDDDLPRLILADWLDEHGAPERAEFIRVGCEIARLLDDRSRDNCTCPRCRQVAALRRRERALWASRRGRPVQHPCQWFDVPGWACLADLGLCRIVWTLPDYGEVIAEVRRGFVAEITCTWADWSRHADAILAACPIRHARDGLVRLTDWPGAEAVDVTSLGDAYQHFGSRLPGRAKVYYPPRSAEAMLAAEWPGVRFQLLPAVSGFTQRDHHVYRELVNPPATPRTQLNS